MPVGNTSGNGVHLKDWKTGDRISNMAKLQQTTDVLKANLPISAGPGITITRNGQGTTVSLTPTPTQLIGKNVKVIINSPLNSFNGNTTAGYYNGTIQNGSWTFASPDDLVDGLPCIVVNTIDVNDNAWSLVADTLIIGFVDGINSQGCIFVLTQCAGAGSCD